MKRYVHTETHTSRASILQQHPKEVYDPPTIATARHRRTGSGTSITSTGSTQSSSLYQHTQASMGKINSNRSRNSLGTQQSTTQMGSTSERQTTRKQTIIFSTSPQTKQRTFKVKNETPAFNKKPKSSKKQQQNIDEIISLEYLSPSTVNRPSKQVDPLFFQSQENVNQLLSLVQDYELCMERLNQILGPQNHGLKLSEKLNLLLN